MYQGQVDVAEEDLPSFLEVAEDLNIRGLSERNMEACNTNEADLSNVALSNFDEINGNIEANIQSRNDLAPLRLNHSIMDDEKSEESFFMNDNVSNGMFLPTEKERNIKQANSKATKQNIVSTLSDKKFNCGKCDNQFSGNSGLRFHNKSVHEGVQYSCHKCKYKATTQPSLNRHIQSIHEGKQYPCDKCDYKATQTCSLRTHQLKYHN